MRDYGFATFWLWEFPFEFETLQINHNNFGCIRYVSVLPTLISTNGLEFNRARPSIRYKVGIAYSRKRLSTITFRGHHKIYMCYVIIIIQSHSLPCSRLQIPLMFSQYWWAISIESHRIHRICFHEVEIALKIGSIGKSKYPFRLTNGNSSQSYLVSVFGCVCVSMIDLKVALATLIFNLSIFDLLSKTNLWCEPSVCTIGLKELMLTKYTSF